MIQILELRKAVGDMLIVSLPLTEPQVYRLPYLVLEHLWYRANLVLRATVNEQTQKKFLQLTGSFLSSLCPTDLGH